MFVHKQWRCVEGINNEDVVGYIFLLLFTELSFGSVNNFFQVEKREQEKNNYEVAINPLHACIATTYYSCISFYNRANWQRLDLCSCYYSILIILLVEVRYHEFLEGPFSLRCLISEPTISNTQKNRQWWYKKRKHPTHAELCTAKPTFIVYPRPKGF